MFNIIDEVFQGLPVYVFNDIRLGVMEFQYPFEDSFFVGQIAFIDGPEFMSVEGQCW